MRNTGKIKFNKKSIGKYLKLSFIFIGIFLLVFMFGGCAGKTQKYAEGIITPSEASMTIIEHDISGNNSNGNNNGSDSSSGSKNSGNSTDGVNGKTPDTFVENRVGNIPYYFVAVYNGQGNNPGGENNMEESYNYLAEMTQRADDYNIKLTLMFSANWEAYLAENPGRLAMLDEWKENGHEIVYENGFGFSSCPDCKEGPGDFNPEKGINEFISSGKVNGIERKWLSCSQIATEESLNQSIKTAEKLDSSVVYGVAAQSVKEQTPFFYAYLDYLYSIDPEGLNSKTITCIIEKQLIPERTITEEIISSQYQ
jgi:hypothetical protein